MSEPGSTRGVPPEDVLAVFDGRDDPAEPLTAPEIADEVNIPTLPLGLTPSRLRVGLFSVVSGLLIQP